jgi:hypothetical protein
MQKSEWCETEEDHNERMGNRSCMGRWVDRLAFVKDLKESYPVKLANYAVSRGLQDKPAFAWWTPYVLKKLKCTLQEVKSKYWSSTHQYGIRISKSIQKAIEIN